MEKLLCCFLVLAFIHTGTDAVRLKTDKQILNVCMDGRHHLHKPIATKLFELCKPWESKSCCSNDTAFHLQKPVSPLYNFNLSHCGEWSEKCLRRFYLSNCFYECSPNVGPWLRRDRSTIRNERFVKVPICQSDCDAWWDDCKDQMTCVNNFISFDWIDGSNHCPAGSNCTSFESRFYNATYFCESIYPDDYKVVNDSTLCMKFDIQDSANPNAKVAEYYAKRINPNSSGTATAGKNKTVTRGNSPGKKLTSKLPTTSKGPSQTTTKPPSPESTTSKPTAGHSNGTVTALAIVVVVLVASLIGMCACRFRDAAQTSARAGTSCWPNCSWFSKAKPSVHSIVHHQALSEDRKFLQNDEDDEDALNPHGALEIDL